MLYGVKINGVDTLEAYGLALLADYSIETPKLRERRLEVPGMDGSLDLSTALTGRPVYDDRQITFKLFKGVKDADLDAIRRKLTAAYHGQRVSVEFPFDADHTFAGRMQIGAMETYNSGVIPVSMVANPWRLKKTVTTVSRDDLSTSYKTLTLPNERKPVTPTITCGQDTTLLFSGKTYTVTGGVTYRNLDLQLAAGENTLKAKVTSGTGTITVEYQEGSL